MATRRKNKAGRDREWRLGEQQMWEIFKPQLEKAVSLDEAEKIVLRGPDDSGPGRRWYRNLGVFLHYFKRPPDANHQEIQLYVAFLRRLAAVGTITSEVAEGAIREIFYSPGGSLGPT